ncbi:MAG TPA: ABC transporter ATP-binding protein [Ruminiclostridium sp.]|nr:ABC transporter ATP-binding protein [Ruminiclostridium sp.]
MLKIYRNLKEHAIGVAVVIILVFGQVMADLYLPTIMSNVVNNGIMKEDITYIWREGGFMLFITALGVICAVLASFIGSRISMSLGTTLRNKVFTKVESFSLHEFDKFGASTLITRTTNDIIQIQNVTLLIIFMLMRAPLMCIGGIIQAYSKDRTLTLVLLAALPIVALLIFFITKFVVPIFRSIQKKIDKLNLIMRENLTGIRVIRAFNRDDHQKDRFETANTDLTRSYIRVNRIMAFLMPFIMFIMNLMNAALLWFGTVRVDSNELNIGNLFAFTQYAMQIMFSLLLVAMMFVMIPRAQAAADRINEVLETEPEIVDINDPIKSVSQKGLVEFKNVTFRYHGAEQPALKNISFTAKPGETVAIIGGTGSGKTTLVNLIPRFYDIESGEVMVDGVSVSKMTQHDLREKIGFVPQKALLFTGTITENLKYGDDDASIEQVQHAAEIAQASDFIEKMEDKYDTVLYEGGLNLSGGQKQRLSIARALTRKSEIYVFDDSFSALDFKTDAKLRAALKNETREATVIIVAQRVGSVMDADRIIVLDDGEVAGTGTHRELLNTCEVYREIVSSQLSEEEMA